MSLEGKLYSLLNKLEKGGERVAESVLEKARRLKPKTVKEEMLLRQVIELADYYLRRRFESGK